MTTHLTTIHIEVLVVIQEKEFMRYPYHMKSGVNKKKNPINFISFTMTTNMYQELSYPKKRYININFLELPPTVYKDINATRTKKEIY
jgi:hypothetical protein